MAMTIAGHGPNIGHGFVKYVVIDEHGERSVTTPAMIAPARRQVTGQLHQVRTVDIQSLPYWTGEDALLSGSPLTILAADRLTDPVFIPALVAGAMQRLGHLNGASTGACVTGLPATWALDPERCRSLGARLREAYIGYQTIRVIPEPLGLIYAALLDNAGDLVGDPALQAGSVGVIDLGHHTVDIAIVRQLVPQPQSLDTWQLGTARALSEIRGRLAAATERELSLFEADQAVRSERIRVAGKDEHLPLGWDRPLLELADQIASRLQEAWGAGAHLDTILIGGGGAELKILVAAIQRRFAQAWAVERPQLAIARGYARLARRYGASGR